MSIFADTFSPSIKSCATRDSLGFNPPTNPAVAHYDCCDYCLQKELAAALCVNETVFNPHDTKCAIKDPDSTISQPKTRKTTATNHATKSKNDSAPMVHNKAATGASKNASTGGISDAAAKDKSNSVDRHIKDAELLAPIWSARNTTTRERRASTATSQRATRRPSVVTRGPTSTTGSVMTDKSNFYYEVEPEPMPDSEPKSKEDVPACCIIS